VVKKQKKVHVITMGCAKNVVDSEKLLAQLRGSGIALSPTIEDADIAIINTCGFVDAARAESVDMMVENVQRKADGKLQKVFAMGCLTERYRSELKAELPELDGIFGTHEVADVVRAMGGRLRKELLGERLLTTPTHTAYLKVSEGCDHPCSFCAIPLMRGSHVSRPLEEIMQEARLLAAQGVRELVVIAQDTTFYGKDLYGTRKIADLIERLTGVDGIAWVRIMYAYPSHFPLELLDVMATNPRVCKYLDMPVQHVADNVLRSMRRGMSSRTLQELIKTVRRRVPGITLRTTLIVGYPAEGEREFAELQEFVRNTRFERLGVFPYSLEEGTTAHPLGDPIPAAEKDRRRDVIMELQRDISESLNQAKIGTRRTVLIDRREGGEYVGRTDSDAPDIDNEVVVQSPHALLPGSFCEVEIVDAYEYDLYGKVVS
jgi:ribosomal protein S12 methylthiotransferase